MHKAISLAVAITVFPLTAIAQTPSEVLDRLAQDYRTDPAAISGSFVVRVDGQAFTVVSGPDTVTVTAGENPDALFAFFTDAATLNGVAEGQVTALTAMGKARADDRSPMDVEILPAAAGVADVGSRLLSVATHFFQTGRPERVAIGFDHARTVHGGETSVVHYEPGLRSAWYGILPGQHINADPADQTNPFPSIFFIVRGGTARGRIDGVEIELRDGEAIRAPAMTPHEFWNPGTEPAEIILVMYGDGA